jgi:hypothetical protein
LARGDHLRCQVSQRAPVFCTSIVQRDLIHRKAVSKGAASISEEIAAGPRIGEEVCNYSRGEVGCTA